MKFGKIDIDIGTVIKRKYEYQFRLQFEDASLLTHAELRH